MNRKKQLFTKKTNLEHFRNQKKKLFQKDANLEKDAKRTNLENCSN